MSGKGTLIGVFCVAAAGGAVLDSQEPKPGVAPLEAVGDSVLVWVTFLVVGLIAGVVYAIAAGTLADWYPARRWSIWAGLAGVAVSGWTVVAQFASWFNAVTGLFVMVTTVVVLDLAFGGLKHPPAQVRQDEPWQEAVLPLALPAETHSGPRIPTWTDLERIDRDIRMGVSPVLLADRRGMEPDVLVAMVRDYRLAEDRWEDTLAGRPVAPSPSVREAGRDLADEIHDTGWDAFLAATPARLIHQAPDPGHPGADATLYELTAGPWAGERVLQVIDASPEDGINRRVGIPVGRDHTNAARALADTWGLDPEQYQPLRHT